MTVLERRGSAPAPPSAAAGTATAPPHDRTYLLFLLPTLALFTLFLVVPAGIGTFYSITDYYGFGQWRLVGLTNFTTLFTDPRILWSYAFTLGFSAVAVVVLNATGLALALGLSARIRLRRTLRAVFVLPMVVSGLVIAYVFNYLFNDTLPALASALGITPLSESLLTDPRWAWVAVVVVTAWQQIPSALLIYLAGLLSVPGEVYEAARIDGASAWATFRRITLPLVAGYVVINTVLGFKNLINSYDVIVGLTGGGPGTATSSVAMTIFSGVENGDYGYQMANAIVFFALTLTISVVQLRLIRGRGVRV